MRISTTAANTLVNAITYQDTKTDDPTAGTRTVTLTQIVDTGGTANGGSDTTTVAIASTVTVVAVHATGTITASSGGPVSGACVYLYTSPTAASASVSRSSRAVSATGASAVDAAPDPSVS